jgi:hypothetical protein
MAGIKQYTINIDFTDEGGLAVKLTAGENLSAGEVVQCTGAGGADGKVYKNAIDGDMPLGVVYASVSANDPVWIVVAGIASVLPEAAVTATRGYVIYSSDATAGRVDQASSLPAVASHNREIGHFLYNGTGAGVATKAMIHFN